MSQFSWAFQILAPEVHHTGNPSVLATQGSWSLYSKNRVWQLDKTGKCFTTLWVSLVAKVIKNPPAKQETWVQSLGWEDALEKKMATHSSILAWKVQWTEEPNESMGSKE